MPIYTFEYLETGEEFDIDLSMAERDIFAEKNKDKVRQCFNTMNLGDPVRMGVIKPPADFQKHVLGRIKHNNPHGNVGDSRWKIPKEW